MYDRKQLMHRVQIALGELHLSSWTNADKKRLAYVEQGLLALDEEQALIKTDAEALLEEYQKTLSARGNNAVENLVLGLQKLVKDDRPRVAYPDRKLLGPPQIELKGPAPSPKLVKQMKSVQDNLGKVMKSKKPLGGKR